MKGYFGIGLLAIGIFVAVMGGFILNADTVTTCSTEWDYVTDIGGAFQGDDSDMDVQYDPSGNVTGWSAFDEPNNGWVSGVQYSETDSSNAYRASTGVRAYTEYAVNLYADDYSGTVVDPQYRLSMTGQGAVTGTMPKGFGLHNSEIVTEFTYGSNVRYGSFAAPLSKLSALLPGYEDLELLEISFQNTSNGYPCIASIVSSTAEDTYVKDGDSYLVEMFKAFSTAYSNTATVDIITGAVVVNGETIDLADAYIVWGSAQFDGIGSYGAYNRMNITGTLKGDAAFMDASKGVVVSVGTVEWTEMEYTTHATSSTPTMQISLDPGPDTSTAASGTISADGTEIASWIWVAEQGTHQITLTPTGGSQVVASASGLSGSIDVTVTNGLFTFAFAGSTATYQSATTAFSEMAATLELVRDFPYTVTVTNDNGDSSVLSGTTSDSRTFGLSYVAYATTPHSQAYSTTYWYNGQSNASVTMVFASAAHPVSCSVLFRGPDGSTAIPVELSSSEVWSVAGVEIGKWEGVELTIGYGKATVLPISSLRSFMDYTTVDAGYTVVASGAVGDGTIDSMAISAGPSGVYMMRVCVTSTIARIAEGGLFLQNASMNLGSLFPGADAVSIMMGSAAAIGDSITFSSGNDSVTILVDAGKRQIQVGGVWYPFNGVTFRWYSSAGSSASIEGTTYAPAIYHNGGIYDAGAIWAETKGGKMTKVMDASTDWTMTLDGIWAPSVFFYEGENEADSSVQLLDFTHGVFRWDKNTFIIVLMAVSVIGGVVGSYFKFVDIWDWTAIIGTVGVLWVIL